MIDQEVIISRLDRIKKNLKVLEKITDIPFDEFVSNSLYHLAAERAIQTSIQAMIDICSYLVAESQAAMPAQYGELPQILSKEGVFPKDLADRLTSMIGMRNVLVHEYLQIDLERVYTAIRDNLGDFDEFARHIVAYLEKQELQ